MSCLTRVPGGGRGGRAPAGGRGPSASVRAGRRLPLAGVPVAINDNFRTTGRDDLLAHARTLRPALRRHRCRPHRRLRRRRGQDQLRRIRHGFLHRELRVRAGRDPWAPGRIPGGSRAARRGRWPGAGALVALGSNTGGSSASPPRSRGGRHAAHLRPRVALRARRLRVSSIRSALRPEGGRRRALLAAIAGPTRGQRQQAPAADLTAASGAASPARGSASRFRPSRRYRGRGARAFDQALAVLEAVAPSRPGRPAAHERRHPD